MDLETLRELHNAVSEEVNNIKETDEFIKDFTDYIRWTVNFYNRMQKPENCPSEVKFYMAVVYDTLKYLDIETNIIFYPRLTYHIRKGANEILGKWHLCQEEYAEKLVEYLKPVIVKQLSQDYGYTSKNRLPFMCAKQNLYDIQKSFIRECHVLNDCLLNSSQLQELNNLAKETRLRSYGWTISEYESASRIKNTEDLFA